MKAMENAGIRVSLSPSLIGSTLLEVMKERKAMWFWMILKSFILEKNFFYLTFNGLYFLYKKRGES